MLLTRNDVLSQWTGTKHFASTTTNFFISAEFSVERNFPEKASFFFFSCAWGLWLSTHWEQCGPCPSFMGAGQSSQAAQTRGENGTQNQGKALPILMLSRLEIKHFMSVQQIETKHSYLRNVKMLHFDPKKCQNRIGKHFWTWLL